jgi:hypothetical protein
MQSPRTSVGDSDEFFQSLDFSTIYHEGSFDPSTSDIVRTRCAEVLVPSPLVLADDALKAVLCRSPAERAALLYHLGDRARDWAQRIRVFTEPGLFEANYTYLQTLDLSEAGVKFTLHPRKDGLSVLTHVRVFDGQGRLVVESRPAELSPSSRWEILRHLQPDTYTVKVTLESCDVYTNSFIVDEFPF